jgi:hypothetical protein
MSGGRIMATTVGSPKPDETLRSRLRGQPNPQTDRCHAETRRGHGIPSVNGRSPAYPVLYEGEAYVEAALGRHHAGLQGYNGKHDTADNFHNNRNIVA